MRFKRTGCLCAHLALMVFSRMLFAQQTPDSESRFELPTSQSAPALLILSRTIFIPSGRGGLSRERLNLSDAVIVSENLENEKLNRKKEVEPSYQILHPLALGFAGPKGLRSL